MPLELLLVALIFLASNINSVLRQKQNTNNGGTACSPTSVIAAKRRCPSSSAPSCCG